MDEYNITDPNDPRVNADPRVPFLVNREGHRTFNSSEAIGSDYKTCNTYCGKGTSTFQWNNFSPQFTGWLLPFLALTAQLPFESDGTWHDLMSLVLTIASPQLAMYSIGLTILNSRYAKRRLDEVFVIPNEVEVGRATLTDLKQRIFKTLRISQQQPFDLGDLWTVQTAEKELQWWRAVQERLQQSGRLFTASLATQIALAIVAFAFTWVDAFGSEEVSDQDSIHLKIKNKK
jgi:hypothetical protein